MPVGSQNAYIYSDDQGGTKTRGAFANPNNFLIVPSNYSEAQAKAFAADIANSNPVDALRKMYAAFEQGGEQDLQRHPQWGGQRILCSGIRWQRFLSSRIGNGQSRFAANTIRDWWRSKKSA
jgi:hypothetical protein